MKPKYDEVEDAIRDVLATRAGRKVPASIGELQVIVAEVLTQRAAQRRHNVIAVTTGGLNDSQRVKFEAIIEKMQDDGILKTRWQPGDTQDATYKVTESGKRLLQNNDAATASIGTGVKTDSTLERQANQVHPDEAESPSIDARKVFVVYGRNTTARESLFNFLRSIGLHPLEWTEIIRETGNAAPYTGEVLEKGFAIVQAVVVLLTPDDEARLIDVYQAESDPDFEKELTPQPRPNVLVEAGMALGLHPKRTVILEMGELRPVSNLIGRNVLRMDNSAECRHELR